MKINKLFLKRFGPFTDRWLNMENGSAGFHLIFGRNEAGKSSSLRAIKDLLFGIPSRTGDAHLHSANTLLIGAELTDRDGQSYTIFRRKGRDSTLQDEKGGRLDEDILTNLIGGLTQSQFEMLFGFDHPQLVAGGCLLQQHGGDVGQSLFAAGSGAFKLTKVMSNLDQECDELFKKSGSRPKLNAAINRFKEQKEAMDRTALSGDAWAVVQKQLADAETSLEALTRDLYALHQKKEHYLRVQQIAPLVSDRAVTIEKLAVLEHVTVLPEEMRPEFRQILEEMDACRQMQTVHQQQMDEACQKRAALEVPEHLLQQAPAIDAICQGLSLYEIRLHEIPALQAQVNSLQHDIREMIQNTGLANLGRHDDITVIRLPIADAACIRQLIGQDTELKVQQQSMDAQLHKLRAEFTAAKQALTECPAVPDMTDLQAAYDAAIKQTLLENRLVEIRGQCQKLQQQVNLDIARLVGFSGTMADLEQLQVPGLETIKQFEARMGGLTQETQQVQKQLEEIDADERRVAEKLAALITRGRVPTEEDLQQARMRRDGTWDKIKSNIQEGSGRQELEAQASQFEKWMLAADQVGDQLRWDAQRVADHAALSAENERLAVSQSRLEEKLGEWQRQQDDLRVEWQRHWQETSIQPLTPAEMREWHGQYRDALALCAQLRGMQVDLAAIQMDLERFRSALVRHLPDQDGLEEATLAQVCNKTKTVLDDASDALTQREQLADTVAKLGRQLAELEAQGQDIATQRLAWEANWEQAIAALKLDARVPVTAVQAILDVLHDIDSKRSQLLKLNEEMTSTQALAAAFEKDARQLVQQVAPDLAAQSVAVGLAAIKAKLERVRHNAAQVQVLSESIDEAETKLKTTRTELSQWQSRLDKLLQQAGCANIDAMEAALSSSEHKRQAIKELEDIERNIRHAGGGLGLEVLLAEVAEADLGTLGYELSEISLALEGKELEKNELNQEIGRLRTELKHLEDSQGAADAAENAEHELADIRAYAERYMLAKLSHILLKQAIEDYRQKNQGSILTRASEIFQTLTLGSFKEINAVEGGSGEMLLVGVRATGTAVQVEGMSDGTRDQMFLSLRLASLEQQLAGNGPQPLVIDDLLVNFDDERATAALKILTEVSQKTQVLFFTHHERLVELAQKNLQAKQLQVHDLAKLPEMT